MSLNVATRLAAAAQTAAEKTGTAMNIAIVDAGGHLLHFTRMDGAWLGSIDLALTKAKTSILFPKPSGPWVSLAFNLNAVDFRDPVAVSRLG
ncbi:heme-binding protein [Streptomyces sp. SCSIO 30461]|uniref:GlcG/HbpS family heme-binding protein n=1 Tax=Streptomyces sp. SCSIO 30461 TaxID=3118085 RepID=UPI0030D1C66F